jgi:glycosyltransferase involved in cell wall biosynthesis
MVHILLPQQIDSENELILVRALEQALPDTGFHKISPPEKSFGLFPKKDAQILEIFSKVKESDTLILTNPSVLSAIPKKLLADISLRIFLPDFASEEDTQALEKLNKKSENCLFIAISETIADSLSTLSDQSKIQIIYLPFLPGTPLREKQDHNSFIVGVVSPLIKNQGIETVIEALNHNKELLPQLTLILIGDGHEKRLLQWLVDHLHLRQRVQFASTQENYQAFLTNFDVVVVPNQEPAGYNYLLLSAMANGVPIVATSVGINSEIIEQGQNGLLFEPGNSNVLAQQLLNLYNHPEWRDHYQQKGLQLMQARFDLNSFAGKLQSLI